MKLWSFVILCGTCHAFEPASQVAAHRIEYADRLLNELNDELDWFFNQYAKKKATPQLEAMKTLFHQFRAASAKAVASTIEDVDQRGYIEASAYCQATEWFVSFMETMVLPEGWVELYQAPSQPQPLQP